MLLEGSIQVRLTVSNVLYTQAVFLCHCCCGKLEQLVHVHESGKFDPNVSSIVSIGTSGKKPGQKTWSKTKAIEEAGPSTYRFGSTSTSSACPFSASTPYQSSISVSESGASSDHSAVANPMPPSHDLYSHTSHLHSTQTCMLTPNILFHMLIHP